MLVYVNFQHRALAKLARAYKNTDVSAAKNVYGMPVWNSIFANDWLFFTTILLLVSINSLTY